MYYVCYQNVFLFYYAVFKYVYVMHCQNAFLLNSNCWLSPKRADTNYTQQQSHILSKMSSSSFATYVFFFVFNSSTSAKSPLAVATSICLVRRLTLFWILLSFASLEACSSFLEACFYLLLLLGSLLPLKPFVFPLLSDECCDTI